MPQNNKRTSARQSADQAEAQGNVSTDTITPVTDREPAPPGDSPSPAPAAPASGAPAQAAPAPAAPAAAAAPAPAQAQREGQGRRAHGLNITDLKDKSIQQLTQIAKDLTVAGATGMRK